MKKCIWSVVFFLCFTGIVYAEDPDLGETISRPFSRMILDVVNGVAAVSNSDLTVGKYSIKGKGQKAKKETP